jgi:hypothetical protein
MATVAGERLTVTYVGPSCWRNPKNSLRRREAVVAAAPGRRRIVAKNSGHDVARDRPDAIIAAVVLLVASDRSMDLVRLPLW